MNKTVKKRRLHLGRLYDTDGRVQYTLVPAWWTWLVLFLIGLTLMGLVVIYTVVYYNTNRLDELQKLSREETVR